MFTAERITLSARLGPTPAYYSDSQDERVARDGPDAYVLAPARRPRGLRGGAPAPRGVLPQTVLDPLPVFYDSPSPDTGGRGSGVSRGSARAPRPRTSDACTREAQEATASMSDSYLARTVAQP